MLPARLANATPFLPFPLYLLVSLGVAAFTAPIPQDLDYHAFADTREWLGIPYFPDVASNLAILVAAVWGLVLVLRPTARAHIRSGPERIFAALFFAALVATAFGSAYYHLEPDNARLVWDRLPLSLAFTALIAWLAVERVQPSRAAIGMLGLWVATGPASALYWHLSELSDAGDVRFYFLLYGFVLVLPPVLLSALPSPYSHARAYWIAYSLFLIGTAGDLLDEPVFELLDGYLSGHTLKHLMMALALSVLARMLYRRRRLHKQHVRKRFSPAM